MAGRSPTGSIRSLEITDVGSNDSPSNAKSSKNKPEKVSLAKQAMHRRKAQEEFEKAQNRLKAYEELK